MKVAIQQGLKLSSNAQFDAAPPTAYQIKAKPVPSEFQLSTGGSVRVCNPQGFAALRELAGIDHNSFFASLTQDELLGGNTQASGKSGSLFWFSADSRFVLKTVKEGELRTLLAILPKYARHLQENRDSLLTKYFGAYCFTLNAGGDEVRIVVMNNVLEGARHHKLYDLKGTTEDRWVDEAPGKCLKDLNFEHVTMHMRAQLNERLHAVLHSDTCFLERLHIMDYSLILSIQYLSKDGHMAIHPKPFSKLMGGLEGRVCREGEGNSASEACVFHIGLIDMLTTYNFKKQVANALKSNTIGHFCEIDTEPPDVYAERFRNHFMCKLIAETVNTKDTGKPMPQHKSAPPTEGSPLRQTFDLLVFDAPVASAPSKFVYSGPAVTNSLASGKTSAMSDLLDFDCMADVTCKASQNSPGRPVVPNSFDLLSFDPQCAPVSASFDLLA